MRKTPTLKPTTYDVMVIGAGLVGCAMARQFALQGAHVLVVEKGADLLDGASKGNSAILHTGFDAPPNSEELNCIRENYRAFKTLRKKLSLPLLKTSALVLAWSQKEDDQLDAIVTKAHGNGILDVQRMRVDDIHQKEPHLANHLQGGVLVPGEGVIDPWTPSFMYMLQAMLHGAKLVRHCKVEGGNFDGQCWQVETSQGKFNAKLVINCAGLYGDLIDQHLLGICNYEIRPRKGQFLVYDSPATKLLNAIILPVPNEITKGVVICKTAFGKVIVGPSAEEQKSRDDASVDAKMLKNLRAQGEKMLPGLAQQSVIATYAGIRPATQFKDYMIRSHLGKNYISVGGIRSTGLSSALGIAKRVFAEQSTQGGLSFVPPKKIHWPKAAHGIAQNSQRDWQKPENQGIVCHCEQVTKREILDALKGDLPVQSLDGLKRRTRVTMGRCQGFYCSAKLSQLTAGYFKRPIAQVAKTDQSEDSKDA